MWGAPHVVTYDDLIAVGAQGEPVAFAGAQGGQVLRYQRGGAPVIMPRRVGEFAELRYQISVSSSCRDCLVFD